METVDKVWDKVVEDAAARGSLPTALSTQHVLEDFQQEATRGRSSIENRGSTLVHCHSTSTLWYTPPELLVVKGLLGEIDLDPCSDLTAQQHVQARSYHSVQTNGLLQPWFGRVYVNPPFGFLLGLASWHSFLKKL